ncbi:T9SS type A sorting domain-containing protein [Dyadobacter sp. CY345]|uniref:T9SS type A sorting domain-containing protein n=1 Tax=Dyadobacter sp. CY345 TaxID=2909335 RepID=UPI001F3FD0AC|nr:T9SS type A sorting domain-containing protein [Dyadobacter sp. CY345]MCF2443335.1 T9SS type A sorting domain-containing protein [Dyadobacter sp. CY345]
MKKLLQTLAESVFIKRLVCTMAFAGIVSFFNVQGQGTIVVSKKVELDFSPGANFGFTSNIPSSSSFTLNDDPAFISVQDLGIGNNNTMWVVAAPASGTGNGNVYYRTAGSADWIQTGGSGTRIDVNTLGTAVLINQQGSQFLWTESSGFVQQTASTFNAVDVGVFSGSGQNVFFLANNSTAGCNVLVRRSGPANYINYTNICGSRLDVAQDGSVYVLNETAGQVYHVVFSADNLTATISQTYNTSALSFNDIAVAVDGSVWAVNATRCYRLTSGNWVVDPSSSGVGSGSNAAGISVGSEGDTPIITSNAKSNVANMLRGRIFQRRQDGSWMNDHAVRSSTASNSIIFTVPAGSYTVVENASAWQLTSINTAGGSVTKNLASRSATLTIAGGETVHLEFVNEGHDYGDAPDTYGTQTASIGASHKITNLLTLGSKIDPELGADPGSTAKGDNETGINDEDGVSAFPAITGGASSTITNYTVNVSAVNATTSTANLCGWIDWNNNGTFEAGEGICKTLAPASTGTTLVWPAASLVYATGMSGVYARFRLTTGTLTAGNFKGAAADGEVEDYFLAFADPLPVKLKTFEASVHEQNVSLDWITTEELNADRFEVEHSLNGKTWSFVGTVAARGESSVQINYTFEHKTPSDGLNLYRLKMIDADNTFAFSRIVSISLDKNLTLTAYPNPTSSRVMISNYDQVKQFTMFNASGVKIVETPKISAEGIDVTKLQQGFYIITLIRFDGSVSTQKVLLVK